MENMTNYENNQELEGTAEAPESEEQQELQQAMSTGIVKFEDRKKEKKSSVNYTHEFAEPREIMGIKYKTLTFYFERLTGADMEAIEEELSANNQYVLAPEVSSVFQAMLAARAAGIASDEIRRLPIRDYMKIKNKARDFLVASGY